MAGRIREVWAENVELEMGLLRDTIEKYPYVAMVSAERCSSLHTPPASATDVFGYDIAHTRTPSSPVSSRGQ